MSITTGLRYLDLAIEALRPGDFWTKPAISELEFTRNWLMRDRRAGDRRAGDRLVRGEGTPVLFAEWGPGGSLGGEPLLQPCRALSAMRAMARPGCKPRAQW